jgi:hypothetical protein
MGKDGIVKVGAAGSEAAIGHVRSWSIDHTVDTIESTSMGDSFKEYCVALQNWSGSLNVLFDSADTVQTATNVGDTLSVKLYPEGGTSVYWSGTILITGISRTASYDGLVEATVNFQGSGALSYTD